MTIESELKPGTVVSETDDEATSTPPVKRTSAFAALQNDRKGWLVAIFGIGAPLAFIVAAGGSGIGLWGWQAGLGAMPWIALTAVLVLWIALIGAVLDRRKGRKTRWPLLILGSFASLGFLIFLMQYISPMLTHPAIHDSTTDLANPPQFVTLTLREDNWDHIPGTDDEKISAMSPRQRWAALHQEAFPEIRSLRIDLPVAKVIKKAEALAKDRGWKIVSVDPKAGSLEATATVSLFRFKDDVIMRVRATEDGTASIFDMRSVSRVGVHDLAVNSERVRDFLADLSQMTTATSQ